MLQGSLGRINSSATRSLPEGTVIVGQPPNFWLFNEAYGWDLTHPVTPTGPSVHPQILLQTTTSPILLAPRKTALVIIDMQNFFLSSAIGRPRGEGHVAVDNLLNHAIPAARQAGIQILWLNWGITEHDLATLPPTVWRIFGWNVDRSLPPSHQRMSKERDTKREGGIGSSIGEVTLDDGTKVDGGRVLMRDQWNTALYDPLEAAYQEGTRGKLPDIRFHKERLSGLWGESSDMEELLKKRGIRTLLFAGVDTDQCVLGTLQDANYKSFDTILLRDGCGTSSPAYAREMVEFNCQKSWGFVSTCEELARSLENMDKNALFADPEEEKGLPNKP